MIERFLTEGNDGYPYAAETQYKYRSILTALVELENLSDLQPRELLNFVRRPNWGNSMQNVGLAACRAFLRYAFGSGHPALSAKLKRLPAKLQRRLTAADAYRLLTSFDTSTPKGKRDLAIASLALDTGLRVSELCRLKLADTNLSQCHLQVIVKGGKWGRAVFSEITASYVIGWLGARYALPETETLFTSTTQGTPLTRDGLQTTVKKWGKALGMPLSPHDFRRTFATLAIEGGAPSRVVQLAGRWSDIKMVETYTRDLEQNAITPYLPISQILK